ncbi:hypothetical protein MLD38_008470 [Melastoma candidum]|uniref:Uncharacterized protein n=1 Tax=Melastoma candidum TaxID=119954 RepID=A0ACB9RTV7_9MYRT|nr:hypothetical protein MLD38_008470 [Melastoma candidum]
MLAARFLRSVAISRLCAYRLARHKCCTRLASGGVNGSESPEDLVLPVLIVGAGPVGLVLSILLTKLGVKCAVLEKNKTFSSHPQAHFINNRSMEVFRKIDGLAEEIERLQPPVDLWRKFIYCTSLTGQILGTVDQMQPQDLKKNYSPVSVAHFSQYKLTRLLVDHLKNLSSKTCSHHWEGFEDKLLMGYDCVSIDTTSSEWVSAHFSSVGDDGIYKERKVRCRFLVGADGAGSTVRKLVGITLKGEKELQNLVSVHFRSRDLGNHLLKERPGMLYFVFNSEAIGVIVAHDLKQGEFVLQLPFYPPLQSLEDFGVQICESTIFKLVGRELQDIDVIDIKPWVMNAEVAENYLSAESRVVLAGDAAHRFPPAGGFGMNTGIQDAHNLAWKLASVLNGTSPSSFLETYEVERKPIAAFNTALSVQNFKLAMSVPAALGLDPGVAGSVCEVISGTAGAVLPSGVQKAIFNTLFSIGRAQASEMILNEQNPLGSSRLSKLKKILAEGRSLQLQFPAEDLGFRYLQGAVVPVADSTSNILEPPTGRRREYIPSADPGMRLPHLYVKVLSDNSVEEKVSTLDLVRSDMVEFLFIIAPVRDSYALARAALEVADELKVSVRVCIMWDVDDRDGFKSGSKSAMAPWTNFIDVQQMEGGNSSSWWDICKMTDRGVILVRPDEHVAWQAKSPIIGDDPSKVMEKVFSVLLGL